MLFQVNLLHSCWRLVPRCFSYGEFPRVLPLTWWLFRLLTDRRLRIDRVLFQIFSRSLSFFITISSARAIEISKWQPATREWGFHISLLTAALRIKDYTDIWPPAVIQTKNSSLSYLHENVVWESLGGKWCCRKLWCGFYWYFCKKITFTTDFVDFSLIFYIQNKSRSYKAFELTACKLCHSPRGLSIFSNCAQHHQLHVLPNLREHPVFSALGPCLHGVGDPGLVR